MNNKKIVLILGIVGILLVLTGVTYAFFNYTRTGGENNLGTGRISFLSTQNNTLNLTNLFPVTADKLNASTLDAVTITIQGDTTYEEGEEYLISLTGLNNTINGKEIPINYIAEVSSTGNIGTSDSNYFDNRETTSTSIYKLNSTGEVKEGEQVLVGFIKTGATGINGSITIKAYIDGERLVISDTLENGAVNVPGYTNKTTSEWVNGRTVLTTTEWNSFQNSPTPISFKIRAESNEGIWVEDTRGLAKVQKAINAKINAETNACNPIWVDDMGTTSDESDDITYFSGDNTCVDMNYVWYSGKLWRITAIYPDGAMKLVTEDALTAINWGSTVEYDGSWVYQWLNEDFYDTLYNKENIIVTNSTWNYSTDGNSTPVRPESITTQKTKEAPIGLLNAYEYYNSYRCIGSSACTGTSYDTGYLNIGYYWWLITPYSASDVRNVSNGGNLYGHSPSSYAYGFRPVVNLKSGLEFTGEGSKSSPYKIKGDMESPINNVTLLSSRSVGEYVKFDNDTYRIVSIDEENETTKLTSVDYLRDNGTVITKNFASSAYFGKSTNTQTDTYWDYYLNNNWYNSISQTYKNMLVDGTYYLGLYAGSGKHYKITTCKDTASTLDSITTKNCTKYTSSDTDKTFTGKVGLPRVGEMFSAQLGSGYSTSSNIWIITPYSSSRVRGVNNIGNLYYNSPSSFEYGVRPSINLKSGIKITGGTGYVGGETNSPFEISE